MNIKELTRDESLECFNYICDIGIENLDFSKLTQEYNQIREDLLKFQNNKRDYEYDLNLAIYIYEYFNSKSWFNEAVASNYNFWKYLCLKVVPDLVYKRHGLIPEYYYAKNVRIYLSTLYWYIHMTYQGDIEQTYECLKDLSTDYIVQIVERPGKDGMFLDVSREIIKKLNSYPKEVRNKQVGSANLLRRVMIQNTAKIQNINLLFEEDVKTYIDNLFESCLLKEDK